MTERAAASSERRAGPDTGALAQRLGEVLGEPLLGAIEQLSSGASRSSYRAATASQGALVVQLDRPGKARPGPFEQGALLRAAAAAGVPVPEVVADGSEDPVLGPNWIVVRAVAGTSDPRVILAQADGQRAAQLIDSIASALAGVHRMSADSELVASIDDPLAALRASYDGLGQPHPTFELALRALAGGPPPARRTLVHGDFRMGNLMVDGQRVTAVLDWELTHFGDALEDLGWLCVPAWRFGRPDRPAAGLGTREQLADAYARHAGVEVDPLALRWWELAGTLRWGVICIMQAFTHLSGQARSIEHAVIGRRACEVEWDLLEMLDPRPSPPDRAAVEQDAGGEPAVGLHDRPTALELLEGARSALGDDVLPLLDGRAEFQLRVSLRALGIVRRELASAEAHALVRAQALEPLGVRDEAELAAAIRDGTLEGREAELHESLRALVRAKLEAANPGYLETSARSSAARAPQAPTKETT